MGKIFYSAALGGFVDENDPDIPDDAVPVTPRRHAELLAGNAEGRTIVANAKGRPVLERVPAARMRAIVTAQVKREAARRIAAVSPVWRQMNDIRLRGEGAEARFAAIDEIRAASTVVEMDVAEASGDALERFDVAGHPAWPEEA